MAISTGAAILGAAGVSAVSGLMGADKAADAQLDGVRESNALQLKMFNQSRADQAPWREVGGNALNELALGLGISPTSSAPPGFGPQVSREQLIDTSGGAWRPNAELYANDPAYKQAWDQFAGYHQSTYGRMPTGMELYDQGVQHLNELGFNLDNANKARQEQIKADPKFGALVANFTEKDFWDDPVTKLGFQFGLDEGTKGVNRRFSANGGLDSGAALKELTRFATDYTGTKGGEAFNRFNVNQDKKFNRLASLAGVGQQASQQIGSNAIATGQSVGNNLTGAGNARAASYIGSANAVTGGLGQAVNGWQTNQLLNKLNGAGSYGGWLNNNAGVAGSTGLSSADIMGAF